MDLEELNKDENIGLMLMDIYNHKTQFKIRTHLQMCLLVKGLLNKEAYLLFVTEIMNYPSEEKIIEEVAKEKLYLSSNKYIDDMKEYYLDDFDGYNKDDKAFISREIKRINNLRKMVTFEL